ncbi:cleavage and polyadenylation specificity factor [Trichuris trichiura]|uniref:Cleavage and polyadenylation specificity factor n=1 Tax=Trichuris trichiura TaxID=36087 RepID=A0A077Z130_TRITR|nr:cleavage and polyadenylation specificity factor [Trichuris trichiura]
MCYSVKGGGQEVGRSCILLSFKEKNILLDCGIHPGMTGVDALPFVDLIDCERIDLLLITHFHLDHCGALPWFLEKTSFRGRCFMTHATKAIYRMILSDYIKVSNIGADHMLYSENELEKSMDKIEVIDFREQKEVNGIKFWCYVAGHVLGACMFMIEIAGVKVLYTGDFSRLEDRHLCAADMPNIRPDALILESTYGTQIHENRDIRESRFTSVVRGIVTRGGRCLIPVFALGRAQELLLILDEYWSKCEELRDIPIYYASSLARKCMSVYQTFVSGMNSSIQKQIAVRNPFNFKHVKYLRSIDYFEDIGPCVVLATPGMLQSGLSRELFESWCSEPKNGCIIAGYCVEGTLAKHILTEPDEIAALNGHRLSVRMQIAYISFSAHTDYNQTSNFIRQLKPPNAIFVHGEASEMLRLRLAINREYEGPSGNEIQTFSPRNTEEVKLYFRGEKTAKMVGRLAQKTPSDGQIISGILVKRNFNCHLMVPEDLPVYDSIMVHVNLPKVTLEVVVRLSMLLHGNVLLL